MRHLQQTAYINQDVPCIIAYRVSGADPSVGIFRPYVEDFEIIEVDGLAVSREEGSRLEQGMSQDEYERVRDQLDVYGEDE